MWLLLIHTIFFLFLMWFMNIYNLNQVWLIFNVLKAAFQHDFTLLHDNYFINQMQKINGMSDQKPSLILQFIQKDILKYILLDIRIKRRYGVIHKNQIFLRVNSSSQPNSSFLSSTKIDSLFTNFSLILRRKNLKISFKLTDFNCLIIFLLIIFIAE